LETDALYRTEPNHTNANRASIKHVHHKEKASNRMNRGLALFIE